VSNVHLPPDDAARAAADGRHAIHRSAAHGPMQGVRGPVRGHWLVAGLLGLGLAAAATGIWFQRHQTRRCLGFYGPEAARRITLAPVVELLRVRPAIGAGTLTATERVDVSRAPGLVHLRRGLVEDANFAWPDRQPTAPLGAEAWDVALTFREPGGPGTTLVFDLDGEGGSLAVVGEPGRVGLGRLGPGLEKWIRSALAAAVSPGR